MTRFVTQLEPLISLSDHRMTWHAREHEDWERMLLCMLITSVPLTSTDTVGHTCACHNPLAVFQAMIIAGRTWHTTPLDNKTAHFFSHCFLRHHLPLSLNPILLFTLGSVWLWRFRKKCRNSHYLSACLNEADGYCLLRENSSRVKIYRNQLHNWELWNFHKGGKLYVNFLGKCPETLLFIHNWSSKMPVQNKLLYLK